MSVMCDKFFGIPQSAVRLGKIKAISGTAYKLYSTLWHESERYSTRKRTYTTKALIELMGGSRNAHSKARAELVQAGLVEVTPVGDDGFTYHLCNPETGHPWPVPPKEKVVYQRKGTIPVENTHDPVSAKPASKLDEGETSFSFGHNALETNSPNQNNTASAASLSWGEIGKDRF
jgi:DNA-binding transcriptional MocR family regulator